MGLFNLYYFKKEIRVGFCQPFFHWFAKFLTDWLVIQLEKLLSFKL